MCSAPKIPDPVPPPPPPAPIAPIAAPQALASPETDKKRSSGGLSALRIGNQSGTL